MMDVQTVRTDILVVHAEAEAAVRLEEVEVTRSATPTVLRALVRERLSVDAVLLHDGGLFLGEGHAPILMEALDSLPKRSPSTSWQLPPNARPWQQLGWFEEVNAWLETELEAQDEHLTGTVQQVNLNDLVCVLHAPTDKGGVYLKASETPTEADVTSYLSYAHPDLTPDVLAYATSNAHGWLVTRDGGARLSDSGVLETWSDAFTKLARFQGSDHTDTLKKLGCPVHTFADLSERTDLFFRDAQTLSAWGLSREQIKGLEALLPTLQQAHERVRSLGLPDTPVHGDAQPMNALSDASGEALWFDWSEAGVAHPFTDISWCSAWALHPARNLPLRRTHPNAPTHLWRGYLEALDLQGADDLMQSAIRVTLAHRALVYHEKYMDFLSTRQKPESAV